MKTVEIETIEENMKRNNIKTKSQFGKLNGDNSRQMVEYWINSGVVFIDGSLGRIKYLKK